MGPRCPARRLRPRWRWLGPSCPGRPGPRGPAAPESRRPRRARGCGTRPPTWERPRWYCAAT
eukprot:1685003-Alexandrium_andersonii.AAC.1